MIAAARWAKVRNEAKRKTEEANGRLTIFNVIELAKKNVEQNAGTR